MQNPSNVSSLAINLYVANLRSDDFQRLWRLPRNHVLTFELDFLKASLQSKREWLWGLPSLPKSLIWVQLNINIPERMTEKTTNDHKMSSRLVPQFGFPLQFVFITWISSQQPRGKSHQQAHLTRLALKGFVGLTLEVDRNRMMTDVVCASFVHPETYTVIDMRKNNCLTV